MTMTMKTYFGRKFLSAMPMNRADYNTYRGWELPADEDGADHGYLIEYLDGGISNHPDHVGYISWSPRQMFDAAYTETSEGLNFGDAIEMAKQGYKISRLGWNGKGMYLYHVPAAAYPPETRAATESFNGEPVPYQEYMAMKTAQNVVVPWAASQSDLFAEDWTAVSYFTPL